MEYKKRRKPERMFKMISILKKSGELIRGKLILKRFDTTNLKNDFGVFFTAPARASGFELRKVFQAAQNTTCRFPAKTLLQMDFN